MSEAKQGGGPGVEARDALERVPFDRYGSYRLISEVLGRLREDRNPLRVLDVGGEEGALSGSLPGDSVTALELPEAAGEVPFEDGAFDFAVSVDAYGRVEPGDREGHLSGLRRAARRGVLLAAPFDSGAVRDARRVVGEFRRAVGSAGDARPPEPAGDRLPELEDARRFFEDHGDALSVLPNGYLPHWLAMTCLASYGPKLDGELAAVLDGVDAFYNDFVYASDNAEPSYRHLLVSLREPAGADLDALVSPGPSPEHASGSSALFGVLAAVVPLAGELKRANEARVETEVALARKEAQVNDLSRRLAERITADELERSLLIKDLRRSRDELRRDLDGMRRSRDDLQRQLAGVTGSNAWRVLTALHKLKQRVIGSG